MGNQRLVIRGSHFGNHVDTVAGFVEFDFAVHERKQGPIAAGTDINAGFELGAVLTDEDAAGSDKFTTETFYTEALTYAVASVAYAALTFLVCHKPEIKR